MLLEPAELAWRMAHRNELGFELSLVFVTTEVGKELPTLHLFKAEAIRRSTFPAESRLEGPPLVHRSDAHSRRPHQGCKSIPATLAYRQETIVQVGVIPYQQEQALLIRSTHETVRSCRPPREVSLALDFDVVATA